MKIPFMRFCLFFFFLISLQGIAQQNIEEITQLIFEKTNRLRVAKGLKPYKALDSLNQLAQYHSEIIWWLKIFIVMLIQMD